MTKVFISIDMEGIAGVSTIDQVARGGHGYPLAQRLMTAEANAAIAGAFDGGATRVTINDSHGTMDNLLQDELDPRARLVLGTPKLECMLEGARPDDDVAIMLGYHGAAGSSGVLAHTFSAHFTAVEVDGTKVGEFEVNAWRLAEIGVPVGLVAGDDVACAAVQRLMPGVETVEVKRAVGWSAASSRSPEDARAMIRTATERVVRERGGQLAQRPPGPMRLRVELPNQTAAEIASGIPGARRDTDRSVELELPDCGAVMGCMTVLYTIAHNAVAARQAIVNRR